MVKRYHASFPSLSYEFNSRYPLQDHIPLFLLYFDPYLWVSDVLFPLRKYWLNVFDLAQVKA